MATLELRDPATFATLDRGWSGMFQDVWLPEDDAYLPADTFAKFLKEEQARVQGVLKSVGLVKS